MLSTSVTFEKFIICADAEKTRSTQPGYSKTIQTEGDETRLTGRPFRRKKTAYQRPENEPEFLDDLNRYLNVSCFAVLLL